MNTHWLLYDTIQQRFITTMNSDSMKKTLRLFRSKAAAQSSIETMGMEKILMPVEYRKSEHRKIIRALEAESFRVGPLVKLLFIILAFSFTLHAQIPRGTLTADRNSVTADSGIVKLKWTTVNATYVGIIGIGSGLWNMNDSILYQVKHTQTITLVALNDSGMVQVPLTLSVVSPRGEGADSGFHIGGRVMVTANNLLVRSFPSLSNYPLGTESWRNQGLITGGPVSVSPYRWWVIMWDDGRLGWSVDLYLSTVQPLPPPLYPSIADQYDSLVVTTEGRLDPILIHCFYIRKGCADTTAILTLVNFAVPNPVGYLDTTFMQATYHFTKPKTSIEK